MLSSIYQQTKAVIEELGEKANLKPGNIVVVGCSTSEVLGSKIGTNSNPDTAKEIFEALHDYATEHKVFLAISDLKAAQQLNELKTARSWKRQQKILQFGN